MKNYSSIIVWSVVLAITVVGCSPAEIPSNSSTNMVSLPAVDRSQYSNVKAALDPSAGTITLPMDSYDASPDESAIISAANMYVIEDCMKAADVVMPEKHGNLDVTLDMSYGIWASNFAEQHGYFPVVTRTIIGMYDSGTRDSSDESIKKYFECDGATQSEQVPRFRSKVAGANSLSTRIVNDATALAARDPEWISTRQQWIGCIKESGISVEDESNGWLPNIPADKESEIRTAMLDVSCKSQNRTMQRLMDIMAQYQTALMTENQSALNELGEQKIKAIQKANDILRNAGVSI